jgi:hypothetical protein
VNDDHDRVPPGAGGQEELSELAGIVSVAMT